MKPLHVVTVALAMGAPMLAAPSAAPAAEAGATYRPITHVRFAGDAGDAPGGGDLRSGRVGIDPNRDSVDLTVFISAAPGATRRVVYRLGTKKPSGGCAVQHELVASNRSNAVVVRRPGGTAVPEEGLRPDQEQIVAWSHSAAALHGFVPSCGSLRLESGVGKILDRATPSYRHTPTANARLTTEHISMQTQEVGAWQSYGLQFHADPIAYDVRITVDAPDGVEAEADPRRIPYSWGDVLGYRLRATEPGLHTVTIRVVAGNASATRTAYLYGRENAPTPGTGNLAGRRFAHASRLGIVDDRRFGNRSSVWFLDDKFAYVGYPGGGRPTCTRPVILRETGCMWYFYDRERNLLQVGKKFGRLDGRTLDLGGDWFNHPYGLAKPGSRLHGTWAYDARTDDWGPLVGSRATLTLTRDGRFDYAVTDASGDTVTSRGRYRIGELGRLTLRFRNGGKQVRTFGLGLDAAGRPDARRGIAFSLAWGAPRGLPAKDGLWMNRVD